MKVKFSLILYLILCFSQLFAANRWLSYAPRPFRPIQANFLEPRFEYSVLTNNRFNIVFGSHYPIFETKKEKNDTIPVIQIGMAGAVFNRMQITNGLNFQSNSYDPIFGIYLDFVKENYSFSTQIAHISTHLSEGVFNAQLEKETNFRFSREQVKFLGGYTFNVFHFSHRIHSGTTIVFSSVSPSDLRDKLLFAFQAGFDSSIKLWANMRAFITVDVNARTEQNFSVNKHIVFGLRFYGETGSYFSLQATYYEGHDPRGNFYINKDEFWGLGISYYP